jgi:hypothetical protein
LNKPVNDKRANAARLPLWMYVLAWLVRTTRLAEHDLNAAPIQGTGATATGDNGPLKERTPLELYAQVSAAYQKAGLWPLFKHAYMESGKRRRANGWFWIVIFFLFGTSFVTLWIVFYLNIININFYAMFFMILVCFLGLIGIKESFILGKSIELAFSEDSDKYAGLPKAFRDGREFHRYCLFRNELNKFQFDPEDVEIARPLFMVEQHTLGTYVAQRPLTTWIAATLTVILGNSAKNWPFWFVGVVFGICLFIIFILYQVPVFISAYRRRYELHRWLAWYEADAPKAATSTPDSANPSSD